MTNHSDPHEYKNATILPFTRPKLPAKRGRPRSAYPKSDTGTPELILKKLMGETTETLDLLREREIITQEQHWCGIHLRWLYTLRHGVPGIRTLDLTHIDGKEIKPEDPQWRMARELEYHEAVRELSRSGHVALLLSLCVHNERPRFLTQPKGKKYYTQGAAKMILDLREGLDILAVLWKRKNSKS